VLSIRDFDCAPETVFERLKREGVTLAGETDYSGLVTTQYAALARSDAAELRTAAAAAYTWAEATNTLYTSALESPVPLGSKTNIVDILEHGLSPIAVELQRASAIARKMPGLCRLDITSLGDGPKIAEAQWKGGGEGYIHALGATLEAVGRFQGEPILGSLVDGFRDAVIHSTDATEPVLLNTSRAVWKPSEALLQRDLALSGICALHMAPAADWHRLRVDKEGLWIDTGLQERRVDYLYQDRLSEPFDEAQCRLLWRLDQEGLLRIDPPPSYVYNQKVPMTLPFMPAFRSAYPDGVRAALIPSALVVGERVDFASICDWIDPSLADVLQDIGTLDALLDAPRRIRERLVFKCASADRMLNHGGRGVLQIGGARGHAARTMDEIRRRTSGMGEPWIVQPFVAESVAMNLWTPFGQEASRSCHFRLGLYACRTNGAVATSGAIFNVSPYWKVAGKHAGRDSAGRLTGSAFTVVRADEQGF
jgi:hypothetical protein